MVKRWSSAVLCISTGAVLSLHPAAAEAQGHAASWTPWLGCWQADGAPTGEYLCIVPDGEGVRMLTVAEGAVRADAQVVTDGRARDIRQDGCTGSESAHWSRDGRRVFLGSSLNCEGGFTRRASGIFAFSGPDEWVSVQTVTIEDRVATRTVRYHAIQPLDLPAAVAAQVRSGAASALTARQSVLAAVTEADVNEAAASVDPTAVQEWLDATRQPYQIGNEVESAVVSASALDLTAGSNFETLHPQPTNVRIVERVVERPVYVHEHVHVVRRCWDPFAAGYVDVFGGWGWGITVGTPGCRRAYYSRYSPWGYDLYGWRVVHRPIVIVRNAPIIVRVRDRDYWRNRDYWRDRDWTRDRDRYDRGPARPRDGWNNGRITRDGYQSGGRPSERTNQPGRIVRSVNNTNTPRVERPSERSSDPRVARPREPNTEPRAPRPSQRSAEPRATPTRPSSSQPREARPSSSPPRATRPSERSSATSRPSSGSTSRERASSRSAETKSKPTTRSARARTDS